MLKKFYLKIGRFSSSGTFTLATCLNLFSLSSLSGKLYQCRAVAQPGSALAWGARGREFESHRPDHFKISILTPIRVLFVNCSESGKLLEIGKIGTHSQGFDVR